ncbi:MAG TPA: hypothetical protein VES89_08075 [Candidatus Competibacteraceae bacterium]|nr:hypothetical protein [Candidatus Competibacteraceae bacterium]
MNQIEQEWEKICAAIERGLEGLQCGHDDITLWADVVGYGADGHRWTQVHWLCDRYLEQYGYRQGVKLASVAFSFPADDEYFYLEWQDDLGIDDTVTWQDLTEDQHRQMDAIAMARRLEYLQGLRYAYQEKAWRALAEFYQLPTQMTWIA